MSSVQNILENVDTSDLLRAALNVMMPIATEYPHAFAGHFRVSYAQGCSKWSALSTVNII